MSKLLVIKANPKEIADSISLSLGKSFVDAYMNAHPNDSVEALDVSNTPHLTRADVMLQENPIRMAAAKKFAAADKYLFLYPMWNFGVPSSLKAYIDQVTCSGVSFRYTNDGPVGLLEHKKAYIIEAQGGPVGQTAGITFASLYLHQILGFMGVKDIQDCIFSKANMDDAATVSRRREETTQSLAKAAEQF